MRLFHGTNVQFDKIDLTKSLPNKDFGQGFYLSDTFEQAKALADIKVARAGGSPFVQEYEFDNTLLIQSELKIIHFSEYDEEWAKFVFTNRYFLPIEKHHDYDIVIGPIANDRVGLQILRLTEGDIDFQTFLNKLKYMKGVTFQYFFGTEKAIALLKRIK